MKAISPVSLQAGSTAKCPLNSEMRVLSKGNVVILGEKVKSSHEKMFQSYTKQPIKVKVPLCWLNDEMPKDKCQDLK